MALPSAFSLFLFPLSTRKGGENKVCGQSAGSNRAFHAAVRKEKAAGDICPLPLFGQPHKISAKRYRRSRARPISVFYLER